MRIVVLKHDPSSLRLYSGSTYSFVGAFQKIEWPKDGGAFLGPVGAWNFLVRHGLTPELLNVDDAMPDVRPTMLIVHAVNGLTEAELGCIRRFSVAGATILACGDLPSYGSLLEAWIDLKNGPLMNLNPIGYFSDNQERMQFVAPMKWPYAKLQVKAGVSFRYSGQVRKITGELQTPTEAITEKIEDCPLWVAFDNWILLNCHPFGALQAWLQGQEDVTQWFSWNRRNHWLDDYCVFLREILEQEIGLQLAEGSSSEHLFNGIAFLHDVDASDDSTYVEIESAQNIPSIHAVLFDHNREFWLNAMSGREAQVAGFHYSTLDETLVGRVLARFRLPGWGRQKRARKTATGKGFLRQIARAKSSGIDIKTIHRHFSNIFYPECVDALFAAESRFPEIVGATSFFRGCVFRWGALSLDDPMANRGMFPDAQFPFWHPFKLANAALAGQESKILETTQLIEPEPDFVIKTLNEAMKRFENNLIIIGYHPYHAKSSVFCHEGNMKWFKELVVRINKQQIADFVDLRKIFIQFLKKH